MQTERVYRLKS